MLVNSTSTSDAQPARGAKVDCTRNRHRRPHLIAPMTVCYHCPRLTTSAIVACNLPFPVTNYARNCYRGYPSYRGYFTGRG